jgi:uncharacterized glyoxalase superfamily protein PhnB
LTVARSGTRAGSAAAGTAPNLSHTTVVVSDVDAYHRRRSDEGATILMAPTDQPRGLRSNAAIDLEGHQGFDEANGFLPSTPEGALGD